jgi:hypothetical protein
MTRAFHGARQDTLGAEANLAPGFDAIAPETAAATMHNGLADNAKQVANGDRNVPLHPAQVPSEGTDTNETEGDGSVRDPTGRGFGT